jgi:hypothetical protein
MLTKLEAVNIILDSIGETPVSSLTSGLPDAEAAEVKLNETILEVLSKGWHQNIEQEIKLTPNSEKEIIIPSQYLRVDTVGNSKDTNVTVRLQDGKRKLFKVRDYSFKFDDPIYVDVVVELDYDGLTFELQNYIAHRAARKFQESSLGSVAVDSFTVRQESESFAALMDAEAETEDNNILTDSPHVRYATTRYHPLAGR